ncbi:MAG: hypothetical protein FWD55_00640 [Propionibacteriaceae bacterium]|nr:hypothetical protein [Propionibacteriaceae bacterium]
MPNASRRLIAYVDESSRNTDQQGHFYLMSAAVIDRMSPDFQTLMRKLHRIALHQPQKNLHAFQMERSTPHVLQYAEQVIASCSAVQIILSVRAPILDSWEAARQRCLAELVTRGSQGLGVKEFVLDTRDGSFQRSPGHNQEKLNDYHDIHTIQGLIAAGDISEANLMHADDRRTHELWVADIAAFATSRALALGNPGRLRWLAHRLELREARVIPVDQRHPSSRRILSPSVFQLRLDEVKIQAREALFDTRGNLAATGVDWASFVADTVKMRDELEAKLREFAKSNNCDIPSLDDYLHRGSQAPTGDEQN